MIAAYELGQDLKGYPKMPDACYFKDPELRDASYPGTAECVDPVLRQLGVSDEAAANALRRLEAEGIVRLRSDKKRNRFWEAPELLNCCAEPSPILGYGSALPKDL